MTYIQPLSEVNEVDVLGADLLSIVLEGIMIVFMKSVKALGKIEYNQTVHRGFFYDSFTPVTRLNSDVWQSLQRMMHRMIM